MKQKWSERSKKDKILLIVKLFMSLFILIAVFLQFAHIWPDAIIVTVPLMGVLHLIEAALYWKNNRDQAILSLVVAGFILFVTLAVYCL